MESGLRSTGAPSQEQRRSRRHKTSVDVDLKHGTKTIKTRTVDVSQHGLFVATDEPPNERFLVQLVIHLPDGPLPATAFVSRRVHGDPSRTSGAGLQLFALASAAKERWDRFIAELSGVSRPSPKSAGSHSRPPDVATFLVKLRDVDRLWAFYEKNVCTGGMYLATPVIKETGAEVALNIIHPVSEEELVVTGRVARVCREHPKGMEIRLPNFAPEELSAFESFVRSGVVPPALGMGAPIPESPAIPASPPPPPPRGASGPEEITNPALLRPQLTAVAARSGADQPAAGGEDPESPGAAHLRDASELQDPSDRPDSSAHHEIDDADLEDAEEIDDAEEIHEADDLAEEEEPTTAATMAPSLSDDLPGSHEEEDEYVGVRGVPDDEAGLPSEYEDEPAAPQPVDEDEPLYADPAERSERHEPITVVSPSRAEPLPQPHSAPADDDDADDDLDDQGDADLAADDRLEDAHGGGDPDDGDPDDPDSDAGDHAGRYAQARYAASRPGAERADPYEDEPGDPYDHERGDDDEGEDGHPEDRPGVVPRPAVPDEDRGARPTRSQEATARVQRGGNLAVDLSSDLGLGPKRGLPLDRDMPPPSDAMREVSVDLRPDLSIDITVDEIALAVSPKFRWSEITDHERIVKDFLPGEPGEEIGEPSALREPPRPSLELEQLLASLIPPACEVRLRCTSCESTGRSVIIGGFEGAGGLFIEGRPHWCSKCAAFVAVPRLRQARDRERSLQKISERSELPQLSLPLTVVYEIAMLSTTPARCPDCNGHVQLNKTARAIWEAGIRLKPAGSRPLREVACDSCGANEMIVERLDG